MRAKFTVEQLELDIRHGLDMNAICKKYCCTPSSVYRRCKKCGIQLPKAAPHHRTRRRKFDTRAFSVIDSEFKAYMLGFISADGGRDRNWGIKIALHPKDSLILYEFAKRLHCNFEPRLVEHGTRISLGLYDIDMVKDLEKYGIVERKTKTLEFAKNVPDKWLRHYLRGVFDGDGSVGRGKQATKLVTGSTPFYTGFMTWYKKTYGFEPWSKKEGDKYRLSFNRGKDREFVNWMYKNATIGIDRKRKLFEMYWLSNDMVRTTGKPVESCIPVQDATK